jgi:hypothetical protein
MTKSGGGYENSRNAEQELGVIPMAYIHELSPAMTRQDPGFNFLNSNSGRHESNINWQDDSVISGTANVGRNIANRHNMTGLCGRYSYGYNFMPVTQDISSGNALTSRQDSAALTWQDQSGGVSSGKQKIRSYNLARSWESSSSAGSRTSDRPAPLGRAGSQQEFSQVSVVRLYSEVILCKYFCFSASDSSTVLCVSGAVLFCKLFAFMLKEYSVVIFIFGVEI